MSEEKKAASDMKACCVFVCGLNPHPVVRFESVQPVVTRSTDKDGKNVGKCMPAVNTRAAIAPGQEYPVDFPVFIMDLDSQEAIEEARDLIKKRIDITIDAYIDRWEDLKNKNVKMQQVHRTIKDAIGRASKQAEGKKNETPNTDGGKGEETDKQD